MKIKEKQVRLLGILLLGVLLSFLFCKEPDGIPSFLSIIKSIFFTFILWQGVFFIITAYREKLPEINQTTKRLSITLLIVTCYLILADFALRTLFDRLSPQLSFQVNSIGFHLLKIFFISIFVGMIYELEYFYRKWSSASLEAEKLKTEQVTAQLESLKNQISPHFLFNSLNTLVALIPENQQHAIDFTQKLSEVYRYIIQYKERELVQLKTELDFIKSYVFLLKMRYPENLTVDYRIHEKEMNSHVAPLAIQMLIENAIKHNVISKTHPLCIEVYTEKGGSIVVKNKLQLKQVHEKSTKTGLENIKKRYQYLSNRTIDIINTSNSFLVAIPLITVNKEK